MADKVAFAYPWRQLEQRCQRWVGVLESEQRAVEREHEHRASPRSPSMPEAVSYGKPSVRSGKGAVFLLHLL
jgi:hypothetical protein